MDLSIFDDCNLSIDVRHVMYTMIAEAKTEEEENAIREAAYKRIDEIDAFMKEMDLLG